MCIRDSDSAVSIAELGSMLLDYAQEPKLLVGDGASLCLRELGAQVPQLQAAPEHLVHQHAGAMALLACRKAQAGETISAEELVPSYLRLPQAERELKRKQQSEGMI